MAPNVAVSTISYAPMPPFSTANHDFVRSRCWMVARARLTNSRCGVLTDAPNWRLARRVISRANDVVVVNNQFKSTNLSRVPDANPNLNGSIVVTHAHNVYLSKNSMVGAGALWIDTTSTDGIRH
jgi:hypothetical protein